MRSIILALAFASVAPALAQETWDEQRSGTGYAAPMQDNDPMDEPEDDPDNGGGLEESGNDPGEDVRAAGRQGDVAADAEPVGARESLARLVKLPVVDSDGKKFATVVNGVLKEDGAHLVIIRLDSIIARDRLFRSVPYAQVALTDEGDALALATLTKPEIRKQSPFLFEDGMDTAVSIDKPADRSDQRS